jgi:hypothetical protein
LLTPLIAEQFSGGSIDEMQSATGLADHGFVGALRIVWRDVVGLPVDVHPGVGAFEDEMSHRRGA